MKEAKCEHAGATPSPVCALTLGGLVLGAVAVAAAQAGVQRAAEALVVQNGEWVEADAGLMVELSTMGNVAAAHCPISTLALEARVEAWKGCWWCEDEVVVGSNRSGQVERKKKKKEEAVEEEPLCSHHCCTPDTAASLPA